MKNTITVLVTFAMLFALSAQSQWAQINIGADGYNSIYFTSKDTGYVAGENGEIQKTTNGGINWSYAHTGGQTIVEIQFPTIETGYALTQYGNLLFKTNDTGSTWSDVILPAGYYPGMYFSTANNGFVCGQTTSALACILKTTDGGINWSIQTFEANAEFVDLQMLSATTGYAAGFNFGTYNGIVYKTTDGGTSWIPHTISIFPDDLNLRDLSFTDSITGFVCGDFLDDTTFTNVGVVFKTTDGGINWVQSNIPSAINLRDIQMVSDSVGYIAGTLTGSTGAGISQILKTTDAGTTWTIENTGPPVYGISSLHFPDVNHGYALEQGGPLGNILKYDSNVNCFAYYSVSYDSITNIFTIAVDSTTAAQAVSYFWDFGDSTTSTLPNPTHIIYIDTAYNVCLKIYTATGDSCNYCHLLGKDHFSNIIRNPGYTINCVIPGISADIPSETLKLSDLHTYPNPTEGIFYVRGQFSEAIVKIYDITGREILKKAVTENHFQIDLSDESIGIYILELISKEGVSRMKIGKK
ncbi:MAG: T9SS type A sorting domain-containing protein [Bacteroidetes bacterium]|nr:T9SS type A sorting domain-containing protein [Bacteroidota bacterium]